ncbi:MAG: hypothetical protein HFJ60_02445 [Clostridia bacterium]|nr:hypothetical protein [Clostridia bacterium]
MIKKIKNIFNLTKIFLKNSFQNPYIIDKKTNRINKKSIFVWLLIIVMIAISYLSMEVIKVLVDINQPTIFLNVFFLIFNIIMIFQVTLASTNIYFFSKDLELILPLPISTRELLIAKFNTILINLYFSEFIFAFFPLLIYGIFTYSGLLYYLYLFIILLIFPILTNLIISIIMMLFMKFSKFIKNKDIFQVVITLIFIFMIFLLEFKIGKNVINKVENNYNINNQQVMQEIDNSNNKFENINKYFLIINPIINILNNCNKLNSIFELIKIIFINLLFFIIFIFIGEKYYLKNILKNNNNYYIKKIIINNLEKKSKKINKGISYIRKEFKLIFKNPVFFTQCIFPILMLMVSIFIIMLIALPNIRTILTTDILGEKIKISVDLSVICLILGIIQLVFSLSSISISAISREGKNAIFMKIIPIDFYKQFLYKSVPQIFINMILIFIILIFIKLIFPGFNFIYLIFLFILANLLNILNSNLMVLVDLYRPNLNWSADYEAIKNSNNKLFQYVLTILIILLLIYLCNIFSGINLNFACILMILILIIFILILNKIIKININKLIKKIN